MNWSEVRAWWKRWKFERRWRSATPGMQMAALIEMLHKHPELRRQFRDALFGKTHERRTR